MPKTLAKKAILGKKIGMTQIFDPDGKIIPVTVVEAGPCTVVQKKTLENDGYDAVQVGFADCKQKNVIKPVKGQFAKAGVEVKKYLREFRLEDMSDLNVGDVMKADVFAKGDKVDVVGISKGKGYQGTVKRWGTHRGSMSHGSGYHRGVGSMGANSDPSKVFKGKKLPGHMGAARVTVQNLDIVTVDAEKNYILIRGAIPGTKNGLVMIKSTVKQ